jgi:toxin ParE1/3/4
MAGYRLSRKAEERLAEIYAYSLLTFGEAQADLYFDSLHHAFELLQANSALGKALERRANMRCFVHRRHTIYYVSDETSIMVLDILGAGQDTFKYLQR